MVLSIMADLSTSRRSIRALVVGMPRTALATKSREGTTVLGRPARRPVGNEGFEADDVERGDETTQRFGDRIDILTHRRDKKPWM